MNKVIGFVQPKAEKKEEPKKEKEPDILEKMIRSRYNPTGYTEDICYKTTVELANEFQDMIGAKQTRDIADMLNRNGYGIKTIDGCIYWVLYEKQEL